MPGGFARGGEVVGAGLGVAAQHLGQGVRAHIRNQLGAGGGAELVIDHAQALALLRQPQHGFGEVAAARGIDPTGAKNQMLAPSGDDGRLPGQLAVAIDVERADWVALAPRLVAAAAEHVVGAVVQQPGPALVRQLRQQTRGFGVDALRQRGLALGFVNCGVGGGVDDHLRAQLLHGARQAGQVGQVAAQGRGLGVSRVGAGVAIERNELAQRGQAALQLPTDLAVFAQQQDAWGVAHGAPFDGMGVAGEAAEAQDAAPYAGSAAAPVMRMDMGLWGTAALLQGCGEGDFNAGEDRFGM